jgi:type I restriction enzyme R subunit
MIPTDRLRRRNLPHWDVPSAAYFITTCLEGSIPARGRLDLERFRAELARRRRPPDQSETQWGLMQWKCLFVRAERWLDNEPAARQLSDPRLAAAMVDSFFHFAGERYDLLAFVVMPSHIHWVFQPLESWVRDQIAARRDRSPREHIIHSINRHTALECNRIRGAAGAFWQHESYDHWVRDGDELERIIRYVEGNPVKAGLVKAPEDYRFSSASVRKSLDLEFGCPLVRRYGEEGQVGNLPPQDVAASFQLAEKKGQVENLPPQKG